MSFTSYTFHGRLYLITILALVLIFQDACKKPEDNTGPDEKDTVISIMENTRQLMKAPGWMVDIRMPGKTMTFAGGLAEEDEGIPMDTEYPVRIGSITKTFTATLVLILCDEGKLQLNNNLSEYYPEFPQADEITIKHLLKHTSGIVSWDEDDEIRTQVYNGTGDWTIDKLIAWAAQQELLSEPGEAFHYSNIGYFLLGKICETETGQQVSALMTEKIFYPSGLFRTYMPDEPHPALETIHGYDESGGMVADMTGTPQADAINFELAWTAGGIMSTMEDLRNWSRTLSRGTLLSDSLHEQQMPELHPPTTQVPFWTGYGMGISQTDAWMGHTGAICGFYCNMQYYLDEDASIIT
ncbi:MAG: serine hydrolase domain-containing protein, partial [Bacteroidales bacterium]|nr:serine hydrolase domain-containing protein [Bacteroidales bacterium]